MTWRKLTIYKVRWKTQGRGPGVRGPGVRGPGVRGPGVPGCGKRGVWWKTRGLEENAASGGKCVVFMQNAGSNVEKDGVPLFFDII